MKLNFNKSDIARKIDVTPQCLTQWFNGKRQPNLDALKKLKNVLNCSYSELIDSLLESRETKRRIENGR